MRQLSREVIMDKMKGGEVMTPPGSSHPFFIGCPILPPSEEAKAVLLQGPNSGGRRSSCLSQNQS